MVKIFLAAVVDNFPVALRASAKYEELTAIIYLPRYGKLEKRPFYKNKNVLEYEVLDVNQNLHA